MKNENKRLSRCRKRRIERKVRMDDKMKSLLNKIKSEKKKKNKIIDKLKELEITLVKLKHVNISTKLQTELKELNKIRVNNEILHEIKQKLLVNYTDEFEMVEKLSVGDQFRETHIRFRSSHRRKNQKVIRADNNELVVKNYPKNKRPIIQQPKFKPPNCPSCKRNNRLEFDKGYYCKNCEYLLNKQKHQIDKIVLRQDHYFSTRLPYADKKIREICSSMINTTYNSTENMINKIQQLKGKTKLKFYKIISNYYEEMNIRRQSDTFQFEQDPFSKNVQGISKIYHEVLLLMKFLQTKPKVRSMNIKYYDL